MCADEPVEEIEDALGAGGHQIVKNATKAENENVDDNDAVAFHDKHEAADGVGSDGEEEAGAVEGWDRDKVEEHKAEVDEDGFGEDKIPDFASGAVEETGELAD